MRRHSSLIPRLYVLTRYALERQSLAAPPKQPHRSCVFILPYLHHLQENLNILRDAAHLQTQLRIFDGLVETRHTLLRLRPALRQNWVALAVAYHLNEDLEEAKKVLERYESMVKVRLRLDL